MSVGFVNFKDQNNISLEAMNLSCVSFKYPTNQKAIFKASVPQILNTFDEHLIASLSPLSSDIATTAEVYTPKPSDTKINLDSGSSASQGIHKKRR